MPEGRARRRDEDARRIETVPPKAAGVDSLATGVLWLAQIFITAFKKSLPSEIGGNFTPAFGIPFQYLIGIGIGL